MSVTATIGRRKSSVARVFIKEGKGNITINKRPLDEYFTTYELRNNIKKPLALLNVEKNYDININVIGGGYRGQADASKLGISRGLVILLPEKKQDLKKEKLLTRDPRKVERKKYGQKKARKKFQFSKR
ncbi:MAG: 30S ribosomal protein S9 [Bacteroidetes bacterium]|nr:30S ribosomal protein S9 [Bacteroidota bacterium]